jgi:hypothetical protein
MTFQKDHLEKLFRTAVARQTDIMVQNILGNGIGKSFYLLQFTNSQQIISSQTFPYLDYVKQVVR